MRESLPRTPLNRMPALAPRRVKPFLVSSQAWRHAPARGRGGGFVRGTIRGSHLGNSYSFFALSIRSESAVCAKVREGGRASPWLWVGRYADQRAHKKFLPLTHSEKRIQPLTSERFILYISCIVHY